MSQKNTESVKRKPRAMPVETIITRFKSAQAKLKKETVKIKPKTKVMKKKTVELKSVEKKIPKPKEVIKSIKIKKVINSNDNIDNEYYPTKLKRKVLDARKFLAPKPNFKVVCGTKSKSKRKLHIPQRDSRYTEEPKQPDISIIDMVRIIEESDSLDDEDLLEILTCPSPVWWEEPPDGYIEEALFSEPRPDGQQMSVKNQILQEEMKKTAEKLNHEQDSNKISENINISQSLDISIENKDKNFIKKRSKLENLLGGIRNMTKKPNKNNIKETSVVEKDNNHNVIENESEKESDLNPRDEPSNVETNESAKDGKECSKSNDSQSDIIIIDNDVNYKPLRSKRTKRLLLNTTNKYYSSKDDVLLIENEENVKFNKKVSKSNTNCSILITNKKKRNKYIEKSIKEIDSDIEIIEDIPVVREKRNSVFTEEDLAELHDDEGMRDLENISIPVADSQTDKDKDTNTIDNYSVFFARRDSSKSNASNKSLQEEYLDLSLLDDDENEFEQNNSINDAIEDSNKKIIIGYPIKAKIEFLHNFELTYRYKSSRRMNRIIFEKDIKITKKPTNKRVKKTAKNIKKSTTKKANQEDENKKKINSYYKCKKIQSKTGKSENNKNDSIVISRIDRIRYCFKCSSIFDTKKCSYCRKKTKPYDYSCDQCGLNFLNKQEIIKHLIAHNIGNLDKL